MYLIMGLAFGVFLYGLVRGVTREPLSDVGGGGGLVRVPPNWGAVA